MDIVNVTVAGSGAMGSGIAQVFAQSGYRVTLYDVNPRMLDSALENISRFIRRGAEKNEYSHHFAENAVASLSTTTSLAAAVRDADLVVEAVFENMEVKKSLLDDMNTLAPERTIFASNTSSLSISEMADASHRPQKLVGMHFFNPPPLMKLVEVIRGAETSQDTIETVRAVADSLRKTPVLVEDAPNFIVNRVARPWYYESQFLVMEGAPAQNVDVAIRLGLGMRVGPIELADANGLAVNLASSETALREWADPKWRPTPLLRKLVRSGHTGRRAGKGYYLYPDGVQTPRFPTPTSDAEPYPIQRIVVVGPGEAALRWEDKLAASGYDVARFDRPVDAGGDLLGAQMVIEAFGEIDLKPAADLFRVAAEACPGSTVFVTTSSYFSPGELGGLRGRPDQVVAMHEPFPFMNRNFVEIARGLDTGDRAVASAREVAGRIGYSSVVLDETPCNYVYRIVVPVMNEAAFALFEGLASAQDIDTAMKLGMNFPLGPLEWADRLGVDAVLNVMETLMREFGDPKYRPCQRIKQMVRAGQLGVKTGKGFYQY